MVFSQLELMKILPNCYRQPYARALWLKYSIWVVGLRVTLIYTIVIYSQIGLVCGWPSETFQILPLQTAACMQIHNRWHRGLSSPKVAKPALPFEHGERKLPVGEEILRLPYLHPSHVLPFAKSENTSLPLRSEPLGYPVPSQIEIISHCL